MKIRKILPYLLVIVLIVLGLAGCKAGAGVQDIEEAREDVVAEIAEDIEEAVEEETVEEASGELREDWWKAPEGGVARIEDLPDPDMDAGPYTIAFISNDVEFDFEIDVWSGFEESSKEYSQLNLRMFDAKNSPEGSVIANDDAIATDPDLLINFNWTAAGDTLADWATENKVPLIEVDAPWGANAWFFGVDNTYAGQLGGDALSAWVNENWKGEKIWIVQATEYESGETVYLRNSKFLERFLEEIDGSVEIMNLGDEGKVDELNAGVSIEKALQLFTDWLTANPDADRIVVWGSTDEGVSGMYSAAANQGREGDCVFGSINGSAYATDIMNTDDQYLGTVTMFPEFYGGGLLKMAYDILAGVDVPKVIITKTIFMNLEDALGYYPDRF